MLNNSLPINTENKFIQSRLFLENEFEQNDPHELFCDDVVFADRFVLRQCAADGGRGRRLLHRPALSRSSDVHGNRKKRAGTSLRLQNQPGTEDSLK